MSDARLTDAQLAEFHENGYVILQAAFSPDEVKRMSDEADRILEFCINASLWAGRCDPRLDCYLRGDKVMVRKLQPVKDLSDYLAEVSDDPRLIEPQRQILDADPLLMEEKLNYKQLVHQPLDSGAMNIRPGDDRFFLHTDWGYYRKQGYPGETLSSAIAIDGCTIDTGPIRVMPGTHRQDWEFADQDSGSGVLAEGVLTDTERVPVLCEPGSVMIFSSRLVHDSEPNDSGRPRRLMIYSHYPAWHDAEPDQRNAPNRKRSQEFEATYQKALDSGEASGQFDMSGEPHN